MLLHQRGLTATYLHLLEAHIVNVGTTALLPTLACLADEVADLARVIAAPSDRGPVVVAGGDRVSPTRPAMETVTPITGRRGPA